MIKKFIHQFASPKTYLFQVNRLYPYVFYFSLTIYAFSLTWGLLFTPEDFVQGNSFRIIYLHVPASFLSQSLYVAMAIASITYLVWRVKLAAYLIVAIAPIGAMTTFVALISGSLWGNTHMGNVVAMGCKNYIYFNFIHYVFRLNFSSQLF